jgi:hypothetical protein
MDIDNYEVELAAEKNWVLFLNERLSFPFEADVADYQESGPLLQGDKLKVHKIEGEDDKYGIIVSVRKGRKKYDFPLVELELINGKSDCKQAIEEYKDWFWNRG